VAWVTTGDIDGMALGHHCEQLGGEQRIPSESGHPLQLFYGDFTDRGDLDLIEAVYDPLRHTEISRRMRGALANAFPP